MLEKKIKGFLAYCKVAGFKERSIETLSSRLVDKSRVDKNLLFARRRIRELGLCVKLNFHTPYCVWRLGAEFLDETGAKADVFWTGI